MKKVAENGEKPGQSASLPKSWSSGVKGIAVASAITGYILGPLIIFGGIGWWLADKFSNRLFLFGGVVVAFLITNILILRNTTKMIKSMKP